MPVGKSGARSSSSFNLRGDGEKLPQLQTYTKHQVTAPPPDVEGRPGLGGAGAAT